MVYSRVSFVIILWEPYKIGLAFLNVVSGIVIKSVLLNYVTAMTIYHNANICSELIMINYTKKYHAITYYRDYEIYILNLKIIQ